MANTDIQRADPQARRKAAILLTGTVIVLGTIIFLALDYQEGFEAWLSEDDGQFRHRVEIIIAGFALAAIPVMVASTYLWRFGRRVVDAQRFPPPNTPVTRDTRIVTGATAVLRGRLLEGIATLTAIVSIGVPVVLWLLLGTAV